MDHMVNMLREHVPQTTRIHYVITNGGKAPNIVPDFAEVYYYVRSPQRAIVEDVWNRIQKAAEGAAMGTGTRYELELIGGVYEMLPNDVLAGVMSANLQQVGGYSMNPTEIAFAKPKACARSIWLVPNPLVRVDQIHPVGVVRMWGM
jgi:aminobenzoyl-glutamate utilization protein B